MQLDTRSLRRQWDDLRYRIRTRSSSSPWSNRVAVIALSGCCLICLGWIAYRLLPAPSRARLTAQQTFLVSANQAIVADAGEDTERFAFVTILEGEAGYVVTGSVRSQSDLDHLQQRFGSMNPDSPLEWKVEIGSR